MAQAQFVIGTQTCPVCFAQILLVDEGGHSQWHRTLSNLPPREEEDTEADKQG